MFYFLFLFNLGTTVFYFNLDSSIVLSFYSPVLHTSPTLGHRGKLHNHVNWCLSRFTFAIIAGPSTHLTLSQLTCSSDPSVIPFLALTQQLPLRVKSKMVWLILDFARWVNKRTRVVVWVNRGDHEVWTGKKGEGRQGQSWRVGRKTKWPGMRLLLWLMRPSRVCPWQGEIEVQVKVKYCEAEVYGYSASWAQKASIPRAGFQIAYRMRTSNWAPWVIATGRYRTNLEGGIL